MDLFKINYDLFSKNNKPLSERARPNDLSGFYGQKNITDENSILRKMIINKKYYSMILFGPPGSGKTTIANIISNNTNDEFVKISAVTSGTKELLSIINDSKESLALYSKRTIVFIDEIHRFNKLQQDYLLDAVEKGDIILIGATTENPYYEINSALISRMLIIELDKLDSVSLKKIVDTVLDSDYILKEKNLTYEDDAIELLIKLSNGDSRSLLNHLELVIDFLENDKIITTKIVNKVISSTKLFYDKNGDKHYDYISAFIKSMRGGDSDATIYYLACMLSSGEDINFIARRMIIFSSEDIGNANPEALIIATSCASAIKNVGIAESRIILSQCAIYLANSKKSNSSYLAINDAIKYIRENGLGEIPSYLKTSINPNYNNSEIYKYPHDYKDLKTNQRYLPKSVNKKFYIPKNIGYEMNFVNKEKEV